MTVPAGGTPNSEVGEFRCRIREFWQGATNLRGEREIDRGIGREGELYAESRGCGGFCGKSGGGRGSHPGDREGDGNQGGENMTCIQSGGRSGYAAIDREENTGKFCPRGGSG